MHTPMNEGNRPFDYLQTFILSLCFLDFVCLFLLCTVITFNMTSTLLAIVN